MGIRTFLIVGMIGLVAQCCVDRFASCASAEPLAGPSSTAPAAPAEAATPAADVIQAQSLLAELRAAKSDGGERHSLQPAGTARTRIEIGRDMMKLGPFAVPLLIKALDDPDPPVSAVAALALGRIGDPRAAEPMLKILQSFLPLEKPEKSESRKAPAGQLRAQACVCALGQLREPRAVGPIVALESMPIAPSVLIEKLGFRKDSWSYMCGIMPIVCGDAMQRIGPAAAPELVRLLSDADERTRALAADHLGRLGVRDGKFHGHLLLIAENRHHGDESPQARHEREAAERVVSERVAALAGAKLIELLHDKDHYVRRGAATALGNLRVASAVGPLMETLNDEHPWVRLDAICSLGQIGDPVALDALATLVKNPGKDQFECAERSVAMIGGPKALEILRSGLQSGQANRREAAVHGLSALGTPDAVGLVITALKDKDKNVRFFAARALGELEGPAAAQAVEPLIAATADDDPAVRRTALSGLERIAGPRTVDLALAALKDPDLWVRAAAVEVLGRLKDPRSVAPLKAMLKDPENYVRYHAVQALGELNLPDLREIIRPMLKDDNPDVRANAERVLEKPPERVPGRAEER